MKKLTKGQQGRLKKWVSQRSDLELDYLMMLIERRINYTDPDDVGVNWDNLPNDLTPKQSAVVVIERERRRVNKALHDAIKKLD